MQILEKYSNFINEIKDTINEKEPELKNFKARSVVAKALGAGFMVTAGTIAIGILAALPTSGLSLVALTSAVALAILGYDLAEIGHAMRKHVDAPISAVANGVWNIAKNLWNKGLEKGAEYSYRSYFAENTIVISKIIELVVSLQPSKETEKQ